MAKCHPRRSHTEMTVDSQTWFKHSFPGFQRDVKNSMASLWGFKRAPPVPRYRRTKLPTNKAYFRHETHQQRRCTFVGGFPCVCYRLRSDSICRAPTQAVHVQRVESGGSLHTELYPLCQLHHRRRKMDMAVSDQSILPASHHS